MALAFGGKSSTGVLVPLLILADVFAVVHYRHDVNWKVLFKLMPSLVIGVLLGVVVGKNLDPAVFKKVMAGIIFFSGIMMAIVQRVQKEAIPNSFCFSGLMGLGAGFTTMIGNLAGSFANLYFLALRFPKREFIGTAAWMFFFVNIFKLPFHIFVWGTITTKTLQVNLYLAPLVVLGFLIGIRFIKYISTKVFHKYIIVMTVLSSILILIK